MEYSYLNDSATDETKSRRDVRMMPWSPNYPMMPISKTHDDLPATQDNVGGLLSYDPTLPVEDNKKAGKLGKSNISSGVSVLLDQEGNKEPLMEGTPRARYNNIFHQYYSPTEQYEEEMRLQIALEKAREEAKVIHYIINSP